MKNWRDLTSSEKAKITRAENKARREFKEATKEVDDAFYTFLECFIYPTRDAIIDAAEKAKEAKIAEAIAEYEKVRQDALDWQDTHPEVVRLGAVRDAKHKEQFVIREAKFSKVYKELGLRED